MSSRIDGLTTMLQIRTVMMLAARDSGVNTCNLRKFWSTGVETVAGGRFMPDEGEVVSDDGVRRVNGESLHVLCHLVFALVVVGEGESGRGCIVCGRIPCYVCDDAPTPWKGDVIGPLTCLGVRHRW